MQIPIGYTECILTPETRRNIEAQWSFVAKDEGVAVILPDGRSDIILSFKLDQTNRIREVVPVVTGPATEPYIISYSPGDAWIGLRLHPSHTHLLWGDQLKSAINTVWRGQEAISRFPELHDVGCEARDFKELYAVVSKLYTSIYCPDHKDLAGQVISLIHLSGGRANISEIAAMVSCSSRHLRRTFNSAVGLPLKTYASLVKFHRALRLMREHDYSGSVAAFEAGYADQSHMIRSFQRYGGFSPQNIPTNLSLPGFSL